eukprot:12493_1
MRMVQNPLKANGPSCWMTFLAQSMELLGRVPSGLGCCFMRVLTKSKGRLNTEAKKPEIMEAPSSVAKLLPYFAWKYSFD